MKKLFLLNQSGENPDVMSRKGRYSLDPILSRFCLVSLICLCMLALGAGKAWGATIFQEGFGDNGNKTTAYGSATCYTATASMFTTGSAATNYSGSGSVGKGNLKSPNYSSSYTGATGKSGCYHTGTASVTSTIIQISNIKITGYSNLHLSFGVLGGSKSHKINVYYKIDSGSKTQIISNGSLSSTTWSLKEADISGSGTNLTLYFEHTPSNTWTIRLDDITVTGTAAAVTYTVSYAAGGASGTVPTSHTGVSSGSNITLKSPDNLTAPAGKTFGGWNDGSTTYAAGASYTVTGNKTMTAVWNCITPTISAHPSNGSCVQGGSPSALTVTASGGTLSYQWKQCATSGGTYVNVTGGSGGTTASYTPPVSSVGTMYYKCVVTNTGSSCGTSETSNYASFTVTEPAAAATITLENYSGSASTSGFHVGDSFTLPSTNNATCNGKTFVGWSSVTIVNSATKPSDATYHEPGESVTLGATNTFYAVFAEGSAGDPVPHSGPSFSRSGSTNTVTTGYTFSATAEAKTGYYQDGSGDAGAKKYVQVLKTNTATAMISTTPVTATVTATIGGGTAKDLSNSVYAVWLDDSGDELGTAQVLTSVVTVAGGSSFSVNLPAANATSAYGVRIYHGKEASYNVRYYSFSLSYTTPGESSYSNYTTSCGAIDPTVTFSNGTYTIGGSALDLRTLWESNSSGAVTFSVTNVNGTGATIAADGYSLSASTAGTCTVQASQAAASGFNAITATATITVQNPTCATPTFSPAAGTYTEAQTVTISCATGGSTIYYTTNGSDPTTGSSVYSSPLTVSSTQTIKAIATASGYSNSAIASATYTIKSGKIFQLVTDASDLAAGDELVILGISNLPAYYLMSTTQNSNNRGKTDENGDWEFIDNENIFVEEKLSSTVQVINLEGSAGAWYLNVGDDAYLYAAGGTSSNYLRTNTKATVGDKGKFAISIGSADTYYATVTAQDASTTKNLLQYNQGSSIFSCYGSYQQAIRIYHYANTSPNVDVGTPTGTSFSYTYGSGPSSAQTFTISGSNLTGNVGISAPSNYQIKAGSGSWGSSVTLTPSTGTIAATTISIRLAGGLDAGSYNGNITFTNSDDLTISPIALTGTVSKADLTPSFGEATYTITRDVSTSTNFTLTGVPNDYTGTITYTRTNSPTASGRLAIDGTNMTFTANYSGRWTVTAQFAADANYNAKTSGVTCTVNAVTRDTYIDNVNSQSVSEEQRTDNGVDTYTSPSLSDVAPGSACKGKKVHLIGWASQAFVTNVGNGTLTGADSDYTVGNGFYAVGTTLPAASGTTYYAVYGEEE